MLPLQRWLLLLTKLASGQAWIYMCLDTTFIYQLLHAMNLKDLCLQILSLDCVLSSSATCLTPAQSNDY